MLLLWSPMLIRSLRPSLLIHHPRICCLHTSPQTFLKKHKKEIGGAPTLNPFGESSVRNMPPPAFSLLSIFSRSAREARERRRDGLPPVNDAPHVRKVYDVGCRNVIYAVQVGFRSRWYVKIIEVISRFWGTSLKQTNFLDYFSSGVVTLSASLPASPGSPTSSVTRVGLIHLRCQTWWRARKRPCLFWEEFFCSACFTSWLWSTCSKESPSGFIMTER